MEEGPLLAAIKAVNQKTKSSTDARAKAEKSNIHEADKVKDAIADEAASQHDAKRVLRGHIVTALKWIIYGGAILVLVVAFTYISSMIFEPFYPVVSKIKSNFEVIFYKMLELLPWVLLFVFGDTSKLKKLLSNGE